MAGTESASDPNNGERPSGEQSNEQSQTDSQNGGEQSQPAGNGERPRSNNDSLVADLRRENAARRREETRLQTEFTNAEKERQRLEQELVGAWDALRSLQVGQAVAAAVSDARPLHAKTVAKLIDPAKVVIKEDGSIDGDSIKSQITEIKREHPVLFASGSLSGDAGATGGGRGVDMNALIRRAAGRAR